MRPHLPEEELHAWLDGALSKSQGTEIAEHLIGCLICRATEAEARALRDRTAALLAIAAPRTMRGLPLPAANLKLRWGRVGGIAAAAALVVGGSAVLSPLSAPRSVDPTPQLMIASVAPALQAQFPAPETEPALRLNTPTLVESRSLRLASRASATPQISESSRYSRIANRRMEAVDPMAGLAPQSFGNVEGWQTSSFAEAESVTGGQLLHLKGIDVSAVRLQPSAVGGRPTAMVRQLLPDGKALWVVEGAVEELDHIYALLEASGLSLSTPRRVRPDYIGPDDAPVRTTRMVTVASYLPVDSLNGLAEARLQF